MLNLFNARLGCTLGLPNLPLHHVRLLLETLLKHVFTLGHLRLTLPVAPLLIGLEVRQQLRFLPQVVLLGLKLARPCLTLKLLLEALLEV